MIDTTNSHAIKADGLPKPRNIGRFDSSDNSTFPTIEVRD